MNKQEVGREAKEMWLNENVRRIVQNLRSGPNKNNNSKLLVNLVEQQLIGMYEPWEEDELWDGINKVYTMLLTFASYPIENARRANTMRRRTANRIPYRVQAGTILETNFGSPLTVLQVIYSTLRDKVLVQVEGETQDGELIQEEHDWQYIVDNYLE